MSTSGTCPVVHGSMTSTGTSNMHWWPNTLNLDILHQHDRKTNPMDQEFNYRKAVRTLDFATLLVLLKLILEYSNNFSPKSFK